VRLDTLRRGKIIFCSIFTFGRNINCVNSKQFSLMCFVLQIGSLSVDDLDLCFSIGCVDG